MRRPPNGAILLSALLGALSGEGCHRDERTPLEIRNDMHRQLKVKAQSASTFFADGVSDRAPVPGTVARGTRPYPFAGLKTEDFLKSEGAATANPLPLTPQILARGEDRYNTFCIVCHGPLGKGDGLVTEHGYPPPPTFHSDKLRAYPDAAILHVISNGQNVMPGYGRQIQPLDRWAVVHYVRALERSQAARPEDLTRAGAPAKTGGAP